MHFGIVITSYNQPEFLKQAIESCFKQTYKSPFQIVIIDDSDKKSCITLQIPDRPEIDLIHVENVKNLGVQKSYNIGCYYLNDDCNWIVRLDGDDQLLPNALEDLEEFLNIHDNRKLGFVYSDLQIMDSEKIRIYPDWDGSLLGLQQIGHLQAIKKSVAEECGYWDTSLKYSHDTDAIIKVIEKGYNILHIPKVLYLNHLHEKQYTQTFSRNNDTSKWKNLIFNRALMKRPDLWPEGRQQVIMQTSGSELWKSEIQAIEKFLPKGNVNGLDIGCSNKKKCSYAIGVDLNRQGGKIPELVLDAEKELPFKNDTLDFIIGSHVVEHLDDPINIIHKWLWLLKPEGKLILVVPDTRYTPKIGTSNADPTHLHDWVPNTFKEEVIDKLNNNFFELEYHNEIGNRWSFLTVLKKRTSISINLDKNIKSPKFDIVREG